MPNFKRIGGGEWKPSVDLIWNDPLVTLMLSCSGRNYNFRYMYKCCFLACFCVRQHAQWLRAELTLAQIGQKLPNDLTDWHQIWHTCHLGIDIRQTNCPSRHLGGFVGSKIQKSWEAVKRPDGLAPTLVHVC